VAELQCSVLVKRKTIPAHGGMRLCNVQKHAELHNIYQDKSHIYQDKSQITHGLVVFIESYNNFDTT